MAARELSTLGRAFACCSGKHGKVLAMSEVIDSRYPIGRFSAPATSGPEIRAAHIQTIRLLPERLQAAVKGLNDAQLDTPYREGGWTVRQVVHHLADSHANVVHTRFKLALTEDCPTIKPYNEAAWAKLADSKMPIDGSLAMLEALHGRWVALLESMSGRGFPRGDTSIPRTAARTLPGLWPIYDWHGRHHIAHITDLRARKGW